jgi:signal transduction histidine kinase/CheY-like chemotaxis protein
MAHPNASAAEDDDARPSGAAVDPPLGADPGLGALSFLAGGGETGALIRAHDWAASPLGPPQSWPVSLRVAMSICLGATLPSAIYWGPELRLLYNDAWAGVSGGRRPWALGQPARVVWSDIWDVVGPNFAQVQDSGTGFSTFDRRLIMRRDGLAEATYWTYSLTAIRDETGAVAGVFSQGHETTDRVLAEQRAAFLLALSDRLRTLDEPHAVVAAAVQALGTHLAVSRVGYATLAPDGETAVLDSGYAEDVPDLRGEFPVAAFGPANIRRLRAGQTSVFDDVEGAPDMEGSALAPAEIRALLAVPLIRDGRLSAVLYLNHRTPRRWSPHEIALAEDVAARIWDAVARGQAEDVLREETRALETLNRIGGALVAELDLDRLIRSFLEAAAAVTGATYGAYFERRRDAAGDGDVWRLVSLVGAPIEAFGHLGLPRPTTLFAPTFKSEAVVRSDDVIRDARYGSQGGMPPGHVPVRSYLAVAVVSRSGERLGALLFGHPEPGLFGERAERLVVGLAGQAAIAIDNARLFQELQVEVAERRRAEQALRELNDTLEERIATRTQALMETEEQLRQSQKMEAVGQLTGGLAHDFNNLLTGITGSLELLETRLQQGRLKDLGRYISAAQGAARRAAALTHRLLAFSRRQSLDPKPTDVNRLVAGMEELIRRTMGPGIKVEIVGMMGVWSTLVDPNQLENALLNLCINARDAMPVGGRLIIETANKWLDDRAARLRDLAAGQFVSLCVSDNGTGMAPDVIRRAFDPFFTTKPIGQGTGLGLSMIYGFAQQSGGQVRIYSEVGQGTMVCLYLPRHHGSAEDAAGADAGLPPRRAEQGETVLIVDDEPTVRMLVADVLEEFGYYAIEAPDGATGLRIMQSDVRIDLLVTDVGLPGGMNGRQMADAGRVTRPDLKVLFITGYAENAVISHGHLEPGMHLLSKPFTMEMLASRIRDLISTA